MTIDRPSRNIKLDERNHVEKPLLDQLRGLDWEIIDLTNEKQNPTHLTSALSMDFFSLDHFMLFLLNWICFYKKGGGFYEALRTNFGRRQIEYS